MPSRSYIRKHVLEKAAAEGRQDVPAGLKYVRAESQAKAVRRLIGFLTGGGDGAGEAGREITRPPPDPEAPSADL